MSSMVPSLTPVLVYVVATEYSQQQKAQRLTCMCGDAGQRDDHARSFNNYPTIASSTHNR